MAGHKNKKNVTGMKINNLEILEEFSVPYTGTNPRRKTAPKLRCKCVCGNIFEAWRTNVLNNKTKGCLRCSNISFKIGDKIGSLTILGRDLSKKSATFKCLCDCGHECLVLSRHLSRGLDKRCERCRYPGKYTPKILRSKEEMQILLKERAKLKHQKAHDKKIGKKFHKIQVLEFSYWEKGTKRNRAFYKCQCDCGNILDVRSDQLGNGVSSCGCLHIENAPRGEKNPHSKHTNEQARQMREMYSSGLFTQREISKMFDSDETSVSRIIRNIAYKK